MRSFTVFSFYYTISGLEERNTVNSLCFKSLINKNVDLWNLCVKRGGGGGGVRAHLSQLPLPYWPVEKTQARR